jgi:enamine deaminase RidA (YjgF/YER057c/UK114 family)
MTVFTTDVERYQAEGRSGLFAYFGESRPATVLAGVTGLVNSRRGLELEVLAVETSTRERGQMTTRSELPTGVHAVRTEGTTQLHLAGIVALDENRQLVGADELTLQTDQTVANVLGALTELGATPHDVARLRVYLTDVASYDEVVAPRLVAAFGVPGPAISAVGVSRLAEPRLLIEIEATAVLAGAR